MYKLKRKISERLKNEITSRGFKNIEIEIEDIINFVHSYVDKKIKNEFGRNLYSYEEKLITESTNGSFQSLIQTEYWEDYVKGKYKHFYESLNKYTDSQISNFLKLLYRLDTDIKEIDKSFGVSDHKIQNILLGQGDSHSNNNATTIIEFADGSKIVYKPRVINTEIVIKKLFDAYREIDPAFNVYIPPFLIKKNYSWHKFILKENSSHKSYIKNHFLNLGKLLGFCYLFNTRDLIDENMIASGDKIFLIDVECFFSNNLEFRHSYKSKLYKFDQDSIITSGILPTPSGTLKRRTIMSALLKKEGSMNKHLPTINDEIFEVAVENINDITYGFEGFLKIIIKNNHSFIKVIQNCRNNKVNVRLLFHGTDFYNTIIQESYVPEFLQDNTGIKNIISKAFSLEHNSLKESIERQILNNDIPFFYSSNGGTIKDGFGNKVMVFKSNSFTSFLGNSINKINNIDDFVLSYNKQYIEKTVTNALDSASEKRAEDYDNKIMIKPMIKRYPHVNRGNLLTASIKIAEGILSKSIVFKNEINWINKKINEIDGVYDIGLYSYGLYDGLNGIALYFFYLSKYTNDSRFYKAAKMIQQNCKTYLLHLIKRESKIIDKYSIEDLNIYPFGTPASYIYLSLHNDEREFISSYPYIERACLHLNKFIDKTDCSDFLNGLAGLLSLLIDLRYGKQAQFVNQALIDDIIEKVINRIIDLKEIKEDSYCWHYKTTIDGNWHKSYLCGFSHGVSGIMPVLKKANHYLSNEKVNDTINGALKYERGLFSKEDNGWLDLRNNGVNNDMKSWCHGSGGIALSKLLMLYYEFDQSLVDELLIAAGNINDFYTRYQSLCHGSLSNIEVLKATDNYMKTKKYDEFINDYLHHLTEQILAGKEPSVSEDASTNFLGMFLGLSGVGYQLLRFYDWENVPSILCFETPANLIGVLH